MDLPHACVLKLGDTLFLDIGQRDSIFSPIGIYIYSNIIVSVIVSLSAKQPLKI